MNKYSMGNLEHKLVIYPHHKRFWTKNITPVSVEYELFGIAHIF